jgi:L-ascorbate metabolism protein UlaG (beta-lactamase superfamily)
MGGTFVMDKEDAAKAVLAIKPKMVIPVHESKSDPEEFKRRVQEKSETVVSIVTPGETLEFV